MSSSSEQSDLPLREIPGSYGIPFFSPIKDRLDYFYNQGTVEYFNSRVAKYQSTVFRHNMIPGPFIASNPKVVVLLDAISFPVLFDTTKVDKQGTLLGTYMPDLSFFGGTVPLAYQDTSDPTHTKFKSLLLSTLSSRHDKFIPLFQLGLSELFSNLESEMAEKSSADFRELNSHMCFEFIFRLIFNKNPRDTKIGSDGPGIIANWLLLQFAPLIPLQLPYVPNFIEDLLLHTFRLPFFPVKSGYKKIYDVIYEASTSILDQAEEMGLDRTTTCHNLFVCLFFNGSSGIRAWFPILIKYIGLAGEKLHKQLRDEIREVISSSGGSITVSALDKMSLTKSVVYEAFRKEPAVTNQLGIARKDLVVQNHENSFQIKKGELIFGYQPFATNDPKIFKNPGEFVPDRFVGVEGEKLLKYVYWSGGRETSSSAPDNKQCPGKEMVMLISRVMVAEWFLRYDTFTVEIGTAAFTPSVTIKSLVKATTTN